MNVLVVSHTPHYRDANGAVVGWGPTVRELDHLADCFGALVHIAPLHHGPAPASAVPYRSPAVAFVPVPPAGGTGIRAKLGILGVLPGYVRAIRSRLRGADLVHVRCPANISLAALVLLALSRVPPMRWAKYAGAWQPVRGEPWSYRLQRWFLRRRLHRGTVSVNGRWDDQPAHVFAVDNPSFSGEELETARAASAGKRLVWPVRMLFVGALDPNKGPQRFLEIGARVAARGIPVKMDVVGDGPERQACERLARDRGILSSVVFHGWKARADLDPLYAAAHVLVLPSRSEGWPKVLSEAMAHGTVPLAGAVSDIARVLETAGAGRAFPPNDVAGFAAAVEAYARDPDAWLRAGRAALHAAEAYTYKRYLAAVSDMLRQTWPDAGPAPGPEAGPEAGPAAGRS